MPEKKNPYLTINIKDEKLYIALINKVAERKGKGERDCSILKIAEGYLWEGIRREK